MNVLPTAAFLRRKKGLKVGKTKRGKGTKWMVLVDGHWTQPGFRDYVARLEACANEALADALPAWRLEADQTFRQVLRHEQNFWAMAWTD